MTAGFVIVAPLEWASNVCPKGPDNASVLSMERLRAWSHYVKARWLCPVHAPETPEEREGMMGGVEEGETNHDHGTSHVMLRLLDAYMDKRKKLLSCLKVSLCA